MSNLNTTNFKKQIFLLVLFLLIYGLFIALGSTSSFPSALNTTSSMPHLYDKPVGEDGFYMLMIAWNLGEGRGLVGNFDLEVTGIQPLSTFIFSVLAAVVKFFNGNKEEFVRAVLVFGTLNIILFAHLVGNLSVKIANIRHPYDLIYFFSFLVTCSSYYIFRLFTYGLETGIYLTCFAILLLQYIKISVKKKEGFLFSKDIIFFGVLVGITGLARLDFGVVYAILIIYCFFAKRELLPRLIVAGLIGALLIFPWLAYVYMTTGTPIPSSGPAQASLISIENFSSRFSAMYSAIVQNTAPSIFFGGKWYTLMAGSLLATVLIWLFTNRNCLSKIGALADWLIPLFSLVFIYIIFFWAGHFYARYTAPLLLFAIPCTSIIIAQEIASKNKFFTIKLTSLGLVSVFSIFAFASLHMGAISNSHAVTAGFIAREMPEKVIGAFQSGVIGFVNPKVINLDGKVNFEVLPYVKQGNIDAYLEANKHIQVIIDWPGYISSFISPKYLQSHWDICIDGSSWKSIGYCRKEQS